MKKFRTLLLAICVASIWLAPSGARAQSGFTNIHSFVGTDGGDPYGGLVSSGTTLFGMTENGGTGGGGAGTVFKVNMDGTGFTNLYNFGAARFGNDAPKGGLVLFGTELYGVTENGGEIFVINTNGGGFTNLYPVGGNPIADLLMVGNTLYGTTSSSWEVFSFNVTTMVFSNLYSFSETGGSTGTNSDGAAPSGGLLQSGGSLFGTAAAGGTGGHGTLFKMDTDGSNFTTLHSFSPGAYDSSLQATTNNDGISPYGTLVLAGGTLYGAASAGGPNNTGTIFSISASGSNFTVLHTFSALVDSIVPVFQALTNGDGANPYGNLILSGSTLYGTAFNGGALGSGTVFQLNTNGSGFTTLYNFSGTFGGSATNSDGADPRGGVILSGGMLFGTTEDGGPTGYGTLFAINPSPASVSLNVQVAGGKLVLSWSNASFYLQSAPAVNGPYADLSDAVSPYTTSITGSQQFFRLQAN